MYQDCNTSLPDTTSGDGQFPHKVRLSPACALAGFNLLFPRGIPVAQAEPNLGIGQYECYEVILLSTVNTADLAIALFQPDTPEALCRVWLEWAIVALPSEWVEVL